MSTAFTRWLWMAVFTASVTFAINAVAEMKGLGFSSAIDMSFLDTGIISKVIVAVFIGSLVINACTTMSLLREMCSTRYGLRSDPTTSGIRLIGTGMLGIHADRMLKIYGDSHDGPISQDVSLGVIRNRLMGNEWLVRSASPLLLTLGLIGTVVGLGTSLDGLSGTVATLATSSASTAGGAAPNMTAGLDQSLSGMASAFGTTLMGALMGGVFLKLLCTCTGQLVDELIDEIEIITETQLVPLLRGSGEGLAAKREQALQFLDDEAAHQKQRLKSMIDGIDQITRKFERLAHTIDMSRQGVAS